MDRRPGEALASEGASEGMSATEPSWRQQLRAAYRDPLDLLDSLRLTMADLPSPIERRPSFPFLVPRPFAARMRVGDPTDPLLLQVLPLALENRTDPRLDADPLEELRFVEGPVISKYSGRCLVITTGACMVNCRYCFRRSFPYSDHVASPSVLESSLAELAATSPLDEVILSGGDPLVLGDAQLTEILDVVVRVAKPRSVRFHTRVPIVIPSRVTDGLVDVLEGLACRVSVVVVVHVNHANEVDDDVTAAMSRLRPACDALLNQSVLLRDVNDSVDSLSELSWRLLDAGIQPYYLHLTDPVEGSGHFQVDADRAREIADEMARRMPGYLVPRLVKEEPGEESKTPL